MPGSLKRVFARDITKRKPSCFGTPSVYHAAVVIFLEFFAFGLLTAPMISVLDEAFPKHTFLMNGLIQGVKGFLSFLSAPLIGALSDIFGRKPFLFLTVFFTCSPIPLIKLSHWWYFTMVSISGMFSVTFSVVLAYVSDVTTVENRSWAYGLVSATFAASLIISPSLGAFLEKAYSENLVITLATIVALMDIVFIFLCVPESLSTRESVGKRSNSAAAPAPVSSSLSVPADELAEQGALEKRRMITWEKVDPFGALRRMSQDRLTLLVCMTTFLSYLPEAGEYSCFFVYLRLVIGFSEENVALFIAICGIVSCIAQTCGLGLLISCMGPKHAIVVGLAFEACQLAMFGFFSSPWILWSAGCVAGLGSITYPALSAFLSNHVKASQQGLAQGLLTGIRGLCGGLGPAVYGFIFFIFQVNLNYRPSNQSVIGGMPPPQPPMQRIDEESSFQAHLQALHESLLPGPPFAFGAILALLAILVAIFIPEHHYLPLPTTASGSTVSKSRRRQRRQEVARGGSAEALFDPSTRMPSHADEFDSSDDSDCQSTSNFIGYASPSAMKDRRRRVGDRRELLHPSSHHQRQPSSSKAHPHRPTSSTTSAVSFLQGSGSTVLLPLKRLLNSSSTSNRTRSHSPPPLPLPQVHDTAAADLANFRVPTRVADEYLGGSVGSLDPTSPPTSAAVRGNGIMAGGVSYLPLADSSSHAPRS